MNLITDDIVNTTQNYKPNIEDELIDNDYNIDSDNSDSEYDSDDDYIVKTDKRVMGSAGRKTYTWRLK